MLDPYGRRRYAVNESDDVPLPYIVDINVNGSTTTTYTCFFNGGTSKVGIQKDTTVVSSGSTVTTTTFAYDKWTNRATATYVPINECWTMENDH